MKGMLMGVFMMLFLSSFVFAVGSEISADFVVDAHRKDVTNYVSDRGFIEDYLGYFVLIFIVLIFIYFSFWNKKKVKKVSRKTHKKKKISKKTKRKK